jgi:hypothetical protein
MEKTAATKTTKAAKSAGVPITYSLISQKSLTWE